MNMNFRQSTEDDLPAIMEIIAHAQQYLASLNIDQWQDGYPDENRIMTDINNNESFVLVNEKSDVMATTMFTKNEEPTYKNIEGEWLTSADAVYGTIHRIAVNNNFRGTGLAQYIFDICESELREGGIKSMRIDTHRQNLGMQKLIKSLGYQYCGVIYLMNGAERLAFEKVF